MTTETGQRGVRARQGQKRAKRRDLARQHAERTMLWTQVVLALCAVATVIGTIVSISLWVFESDDRRLTRASYRADTIQALQQTLLNAGFAQDHPLARYEAGYALRQLQNLGAPRRIIGSDIVIEQADLGCLNEVHLEAETVRLTDVVLDNTDLTIVANQIEIIQASGSGTTIWVRPKWPDEARQPPFLTVQYSLLDDAEFLRVDPLPSVSIVSSVLRGGEFDFCCGPVAAEFSFVSGARLSSSSGVEGHVSGFRAAQIHPASKLNPLLCFSEEGAHSSSCPPDEDPVLSVAGERLEAPWGAWFLAAGGVRIDLNDQSVPTYLDQRVANEKIRRIEFEQLKPLGSTLAGSANGCKSRG